MQKHHFISLFFFLFAFSETAFAAIYPLPHYQGDYTLYNRRKQLGGRNKTEITCSAKGGVTGTANQICSGPVAGISNCYSRCWCSDEYKYTSADLGTGKPCASLSGACTYNGTTYYKICNMKPCSSIGSTYLGDVKKNQLSSFYFSFTPVSGIIGQDGQCYTCSCPADWRSNYYVDNAEKWDTCTTNGFSPCSGSTKYRITKCVNGYKLVNKDTPQNASCEACAKGEYSNGADCIKCAPGTYADNTGTAACKTCPPGWTNIPNVRIIGAVSVEGTCKKCPAGTYKASSGAADCTQCPADKPSSPEGSTSESACVSTCTPSSCTSSVACQGSKCTGFSSIQMTNAAQIGNGVSAYKSCTATNCSDTSYQHGYLVTACKSDKDGWSINSGKTNCECAYSSNDTVYKYTQAECANAACNLGCNDKYKFNACNGVYYGVAIGTCPVPQSTDCKILGYTAVSCASGKTKITCPFDKSKAVCL